MSDEKWFSSGRGIFCRDAGFQLATMPMTVNWQEDTARMIELLNKGERYDDLLNSEHLACERGNRLARQVQDLLTAIQTATVGMCLDADRVSKYRACLLCRRDLNVCERDYRVCVETDALDRACSGAKVRALVSGSA